MVLGKHSARESLDEGRYVGGENMVEWGTKYRGEIFLSGEHGGMENKVQGETLGKRGNQSRWKQSGDKTDKGKK